MASFFRNYLVKFALMAAIALWAGCSEADKNAEKSTEQENTVFEFPVDSKYVTLKIPFRPIQFQDSLFDANGVSIQVFKDYSVESSLVYNDDVEKIAQIIHKESKSIYEIFDSFYKKETCHELYEVSLSLKVSLGTNGVVDKVKKSSSLYADQNFTNKIIEYVKQINFQDVGRNNILLSINFCRPFIDANDFNALLHDLQWKEYSIRKTNGAVSAPTSDEMKSAGGDEHDKDSILKVIRQRTPGLRHIYNKHLRKNRAKACLKNNQDNSKPDFNGMIVFKLNINDDGSVQKAEIQSSNTGNKDFDDEVKRALSHWKFLKMNSSEVVTFPLVFFENTTPYKKPTYPEIRI
ncbi:AgmX/PglI C-terminal domain-containing protein [Fibrobacter succinogenes]|uniref:AgmX/PglI C-terminal domain-containing protein n=1 Tax=Fibrobacter succinogenes TaxID=833 RepID=UPI001568B894|nr:AgmX/PglI C-terminal domain-containing protein [Fibrobacter succinogenes]